MVRKREGTESDENKEECLSFVNPVQVCVVHFIRARANCLAIVAMLFKRKLGDRFNIYDVSDGNIKLTNIVNIAMI